MSHQALEQGLKHLQDEVSDLGNMVESAIIETAVKPQ